MNAWRLSWGLALLGLVAVVAAALPGVTSPGALVVGGVGCDYNDDGFGDVVVMTEFTVGVFHGGAAGLGPREEIFSTTDRDERFLHQAVACGDFDGDGYDDAAFGAAYRGLEESLWTLTAVAHGGPDGLGDVGEAVIVAGWRKSSANNPQYGWALAVGDLNADGYDDLAVGAHHARPDQRNATGEVAVLYGSPSSLDLDDPFVFDQDTPGISGARETGDNFGNSVAIGDFDSDGYDDLAIGVVRENLGSIVDAGMIHVIRGSAAGLDLTTERVIHQDKPSVRGKAEIYDEFGAELVAADLDGDGYDDLVVSSPGEALGDVEHTGMVQVLPGSSSGLTATGMVSLTTRPNERPYDEVGTQLAVADVDGDGLLDVVTVAPGRPIDLRSDGVVAVWLGRSGAFPAGAPVVEPGPTTVEPVVDEFAGHLAVVDIDGDGTVEIVTRSSRTGFVVRTLGGAATLVDDIGDEFLVAVG